MWSKLNDLSALTSALTLDAQAIDARLRAHPSRSEWLALLGAMGVLAGCIFAHIYTRHKPYDYEYYMAAARGDFSLFLYGYWIWPIFVLFNQLPLFVGYALFGAINIASTWFAARVWGGRGMFVLLGFQLLYTLYFGNMAGITAGGLALMWWGMAHRRWPVAGAAMLVVMTKYQSGGLFALLLIWLAQVPWRDKLKVLLIPCLGVLATFLIHPTWLFEVIDRSRINPPNTDGSVSLWRWLGPWALSIFIPPLVLPMRRPQRFVALITALSLGGPYFQQTDLLFLQTLPLPWGWPALLGNLGYLYIPFRWQALRYLVVVPMSVYGVIIVQAVRAITARQN